MLSMLFIFTFNQVPYAPLVTRILNHGAMAF